MSDVVAADDASESILASTSTRWTPDMSTSFFNAFVTILNDEAVATITEADFRLSLVTHMQQQHDIAVDSAVLVSRLGSARKHAEDYAVQLQAFTERHRKWEESREAWLAQQRERRQVRAVKAARRRPPQQAVDSEAEFDVDEPLQLPQSVLQKAKLAASEAYEKVRGRFEAEKKQRQAARAEASRVAHKERKRLERQRMLVSTLNANLPDDANDDASMNDAASSASTSASVAASSSSSSPAKRKFNAAAVVGVYTEYCAQAVVSQAQLAADLRQAMREQADATAAYRTEKLKAEKEYRAAKLSLMRGDKENSNPNRV